MLLLSSLIFIVNLLIDDIGYLLILGIFILLISYKKKYKKIPLFIFIFYLSLSLSRIFFIQEGRVLFQIYKFYITKEALEQIAINYIRILNILFLSRILTQKINIGRFKTDYANIIKLIIEFVPQIFTVFKKRVGIQKLYKKILVKVYRKL